MSRAMVWLQMGDFARGWPECAWRLCSPDLPIHRLRGPLWDGSELRGKTILIAAEQGLGDTIQFIRYAPWVARRAGRVVVTCAPGLRRLLASCAGVDEVVCDGEPLPEYACYAPVMSLPAILGTTPETIPAEVPYLRADRLPGQDLPDALTDTAGYKVGVVWQGNPRHTKDRERSFRLAHFAPWPGCRACGSSACKRILAWSRSAKCPDAFR